MGNAPGKNESDTAPTPVPPLNLAGNFQQVREEVLAEITAICESGYYVLGPKVVAFEEALAGYTGAKHAVGTSSGTDALLTALMALDIGRGDEVIVPAFTFFATAGCVTRVGARPVFCDIDPETYNLDVGQIEDRLTTRTKAVIPVHLYGQLGDLPALFKIVGRHGIAVIEDAAQAIGAKYDETDAQSAGAFGTCGCLSFYPTKNLGAIGDAGAFLTNDHKLAETARLLRVHGSGHTYHHSRIGGNFRIDALQAAILTVKLKHLDAWTARRRERAARYTRLLEDAGLVPEHVRPPKELNGVHVYHQYVIRVQRRDELAEHLKARKIGCGVYYPLPLHLQECFAYLGGKPGDFPESEKAAAEVLALPIYPELTDGQQDAVIAAIAAFCRR
jgi:dTDP-4-amino-4,6-dideoxygalactose transaminase